MMYRWYMDRIPNNQVTRDFESGYPLTIEISMMIFTENQNNLNQTHKMALSTYE